MPRITVCFYALPFVLACSSGSGAPAETTPNNSSDAGGVDGPDTVPDAADAGAVLDGMSEKDAATADVFVSDGLGSEVAADAPEAPDVIMSHVWPVMPYVDRYAGLEGLEGQPLVDELCKLVTDGYVSISYTEARTVVFGHIDNHEGQVRTVYEGLWHPTNPHTELNIEHTWPQSKGAEGIAKSDMHHLFPEQQSFNSARSNHPFGEVVVRTWPDTLTGDASCTEHWTDHVEGCYSKKGKDSAGVTVFEPRDAHKGDAARAVFYFSLRYGEGCKVKPLVLFDENHPAVTEAILKHWNYVDQPDQHERGRNDGVEHTQKVRNPFIDHPELIDRISFQ